MLKKKSALKTKKDTTLEGKGLERSSTGTLSSTQADATSYSYSHSQADATYDVDPEMQATSNWRDKPEQNDLDNTSTSRAYDKDGSMTNNADSTAYPEAEENNGREWRDPGHQHIGQGMQTPNMPAGMVAEKDPFLGKIDAYVDECNQEPEKMHSHEIAKCVLAWLVFAIVTTIVFTVCLLMVVRFFMSRPFATFAVVSMIVFLAFLGVAYSHRQRWVRHMFSLCPLVAVLGVIAGIGVLLRNGGLLHFYQEDRWYTNVYASQPAVQFADAAIFLFEKGETQVDTTRHVSFMDHWSGTRYCVAPVIDDQMTNTDPINFWVVGKDCCDMKYFHCHEFDGFSSTARDLPKTALVVPRAAEITPVSWLTWLVKGAGQHDTYQKALEMSHARLGTESAEGALLLHWTLQAHASVQELSDEVWESVWVLIIVFAILALFFAFRFVKHDTLRRGKEWPKFNPRAAMNRRTYHHGLADGI